MDIPSTGRCPLARRTQRPRGQRSHVPWIHDFLCSGMSGLMRTNARPLVVRRLCTAVPLDACLARVLEVVVIRVPAPAVGKSPPTADRPHDTRTLHIRARGLLAAVHVQVLRRGCVTCACHMSYTYPACPRFRQCTRGGDNVCLGCSCRRRLRPERPSRWAKCTAAGDWRL